MSETKKKVAMVLPEYESLYKVLIMALEQASDGKGKERHANDDAFENQIMCYMASQLGIAGPAFQVVKKTVEACRLPYPENVKEILGAINYAAGMVIEEERKAQALAEAMVIEEERKAQALAEAMVTKRHEVLKDSLTKALLDRDAFKVMPGFARGGLVPPFHSLYMRDVTV